MRGGRRKRFTLEFVDAEPIEGRLRAENGPSRKFVGWLGLAAALESVLEPLPAERGATGSWSGAATRLGER